jgi:hypothetical protein
MSAKTDIIAWLFDRRWDAAAQQLSSPVVTLEEVAAAIRIYNLANPGRKAMSTRNPANFFKDFISSARRGCVGGVADREWYHRASNRKELAMELPFPGMDPYLESVEYWSSFHHHLAEELMTMLNASLGPAYFADVEVRASLDDLGVLTSIDIYPDVAVLGDDTAHAATAAVPLATAPIQRLALPAERARSRTVQVRRSGTKALVTAIELLSPANKQGRGLEQYRQKRERVLLSDCHLLELDLLRRGQRPGWEVAEPPLEAAYVCLVNRARADELRMSEIWPLALAAPLPTLPIPLLPPDPDVLLDLGAALRAIYVRARYERRIDYRAAPPPPELAPDDAAWLDAHLRERGLRG